MDLDEINEYEIEAKERGGNTDQYKEFERKNKSKQENEENVKKLMKLFAEIGMLKNLSVEDKEVQEKIKELQEFITSNYYNCTNEVLNGLGQMYISDERFRKKIDKEGGEGTTEFVHKAILVYCLK